MKKMMFNDRFGLTEAVLQGRKTVTRRELKMTRPRSLANCLQGIKYECMVDENDNSYEALYYVGEIVAVAQGYKNAGYAEETVFYSSIPKMDGYLKVNAIDDKGWNNKMFVCANLMPHQIRILDVRAERLQDITDEDCLREGINKYTKDKIVYKYDLDDGFEMFPWRDMKRTPKEAFAALIDKISGKGTWERNPFVWRIEFKLIK